MLVRIVPVIHFTKKQNSCDTCMNTLVKVTKVKKQFGIHPLTLVGGRAVECGPTADL